MRGRTRGRCVPRRAARVRPFRHVAAAWLAVGLLAPLLRAPAAVAAAAPVAVALTPSSGTLASGSNATLTLQANVPAGEAIGSWTIDVTYDPSALTATDCTSNAGGGLAACSATYASGDARITGASASGATGGVDLGTVVFSPVAGGAGGTTTVNVVVVSLTDAAGASLPSTTAAAQITVEGGSAPAGAGGGGGGGGGGAVSTTPNPPTTPNPTSSGAASVGAGGGVLATPDGAFSLNVPSGALSGSATLAAGDSCAAPSGLPAGLTAAGCVVTLQGDPLPSPEPAVFRFEAAGLKGLSADRLSVYRSVAPASGGGWRFVPTAVDTAAGTASAGVDATGAYVVAAATRRFPDVPAGYWARSDIDVMLAAGVLAGFPNGTLQPGAAVTRAQFVKMLALTEGLAARSGATTFHDVPRTAWFAPYVAAAVAAGIVQGTSAATFDPNAVVTREQLAVILARALKLPAGAKLAFHDAASVSPWAVSGVEAAVAAGYLNGLPGGTFDPVGPATRAQAAKVLSLVIAHLAP